MRALDRRPRPQQCALMEQYWPISHMAKKDCSSRMLILPQPHVSARSTANMARKAQLNLEVFDHALTCYKHRFAAAAVGDDVGYSYRLLFFWKVETPLPIPTLIQVLCCPMFQTPPTR